MDSTELENLNSEVSVPSTSGSVLMPSPQLIHDNPAFQTIDLRDLEDEGINPDPLPDKESPKSERSQLFGNASEKRSGV